MKKAFALLISCFYLVFCIGSLRAEASLLENKESQENIFSVKQAEESAVNHFTESPGPKKSYSAFSHNKVLSEGRLQTHRLTSIVPLFLRNCNFRR